MNSVQIRCFLAAARLGGFPAAADALYYAPQTLAQHISSLETELGVRLFDRRGAAAALTQAGTYYAALFAAQGEALAAAREEAAAHYRARPSLRIGCSEWLNPGRILQTAILPFQSAHSDAALSFRLYGNSQLLDALLDGRVDAALFSEGHLPQHRDVEAAAVANEQLCLFGPKELFGPDAPDKAARRRLFYLTVAGRDRSYLETKTLIRQELSGAGLSDCPSRIVPTPADLRAQMMLSGGVAVSDRYYGFLNGIPTLGFKPLEERTELFCCYLPLNENALVPVLLKELRALFGYRPGGV